MAKILKFCIQLVVAGVILSGCAKDGKQTVMQKTYTLETMGAPNLHLVNLPASQMCKASSPVLYIHGATFPSDTSIGFKMDGQSWMDNLSESCFSVWALDFAGYGKSDRYSNKNRNGITDPIYGRSHEVAPQIKRAVDFILKQESTSRLSLIAHSWGTIPAGQFTAQNADYVDRLVLFGPIAQREYPKQDQKLSPTRLVTVEAQHQRFIQDTPKDHPSVLTDMFETWGRHFLASDPDSQTHNPPAVSVPSGPVADIGAAWTGKFPYDPSKVMASVLIIHGEWDSVSTDADVLWLLEALTSAESKQAIKVKEAGHLMHLEKNRAELYAAICAFLQERGGRNE